MKTYFCKRIDSRIEVDGDLKKPQWLCVEGVSFFDNISGLVPRQKTEAKLVWDNNFIYVAFHVQDDLITSTMRQFNDLLYEEDVVEIFLDDNSDLKTYIEVEINPLNAILHYGIHNHLNGDFLKFARVHHTVKSAVIYNEKEKFWSAELAIPFSEFATAPNIPPKPGDRWKMNLYRIDRQPGGEDEYTAWCPTGILNYHLPNFFGEVIFQE